MISNLLCSLVNTADRDLLAEVDRMASREREATASLVVYLAELDARKLYLAEGFPSLFSFLTERLHYAEHAAYNRIEVARAARRFPAILDLLADGSVHLTAVRFLSPHLTDGNHRDLLAAARHKSRREVERIVAGLGVGRGSLGWRKKNGHQFQRIDWRAFARSWGPSEA